MTFLWFILWIVGKNNIMRSDQRRRRELANEIHRLAVERGLYR